MCPKDAGLSVEKLRIITLTEKEKIFFFFAFIGSFGFSNCFVEKNLCLAF